MTDSKRDERMKRLDELASFAATKPVLREQVQANRGEPKSVASKAPRPLEPLTQNSTPEPTLATIAARLEQDIAALEAKKVAAAELAAREEPERARVAELQKKYVELAREEREARRPRKQPPPPESVVRGTGMPNPNMMVKRDVPLDWSFWRHMRTVKLWQACALVVGLDPDRLKHHPQGWMAGPNSGPVFDPRSFSSAEEKERLNKAMRLAATAVRYMTGPIYPKGTPVPGNNLDKDVALSEVVAFFRSCEWADIPSQLLEIAEPTRPKENEPETKPLRKAPMSVSKRSWRDVAWPYVLKTFKAGQYATAKSLYQALERSAGHSDSPFVKGTGSHMYSLFVHEIGQPVSLKTLQNAWADIQAGR